MFLTASALGDSICSLTSGLGEVSLSKKDKCTDFGWVVLRREKYQGLVPEVELRPSVYLLGTDVGVFSGLKAGSSQRASPSGSHWE